MSKKLLALGSVVLAASLMTGPAFAAISGGKPPPQSLTVSTQSLNLKTQPGATRLLSRIGDAASMVCGGIPLPQTLNLSHRYDRCYENAIDAAVTKAKLPTLAKAYAGSSGMGASEVG